MARKTHTSTEVKQRWIDKTYKQYRASLRYDTDQDLIEYIEEQKSKGIQISELFREALQMHKDSQ